MVILNRSEFCKEVFIIIRLQIDVPRGVKTTVITSRDAVKNLIDSGLVRYGATINRQQPARYGFGVVAKRVETSSNHILHRVERVVVGTSDPELAAILRKWTANDLVEPNAVPGAGLDLRAASIQRVSDPIIGEAIALYALSPLRIVEGNPGRTILELGPRWEEGLNRTMERRFHRPFHLRFIPDSFYVRSRRGKITAHMAVKIRGDGYVVAYPGIVLPFILAGPPDELRIAWHSGLGSSTAMGFGCVEVAQ